jgi:hypothetical protein
MTIVELITFSIICYSLAYGWIESPLFKDRIWHKLANKIHPHLTTCFHCVGFWVGMLVWWQIEWYKIEGFPSDIIWGGLLGSGICLILDKLMLLIESKIKE